jgi:hypothetical protein
MPVGASKIHPSLAASKTGDETLYACAATTQTAVAFVRENVRSISWQRVVASVGVNEAMSSGKARLSTSDGYCFQTRGFGARSTTGV